MTDVAVTGGTGLLGRLVVERLTEQGHRVKVLTHRAPDRSGAPTSTPSLQVVSGDLRDREQVARALTGVDAVVHCGSDPRHAQEVDVTGTQHLLEGMRRAGCRHLVYVSIVGVDRIPVTYYKAKLEAERRIEDQDGVPWTIQRATQFHPFLADMLARLVRLPVIPLPSALRFQPVDVQEVADRLVEQVLAAPVGRAPDFGGPEVLTARELAGPFLESRSTRRLILPAPLPGALGRAFRAGANLCPDHAHGRRTWQQFLGERQVPDSHVTRSAS
jgi:uncharacterized protein YbjT (DUF2867 family)